MFQESKLERMIHKYQDFKTKTGSLPRFDEVYRRNILQQPKFMKDLHKVEKETRVETLQVVKLVVLCCVGTECAIDGQDEHTELRDANKDEVAVDHVRTTHNEVCA